MAQAGGTVGMNSGDDDASGPGGGLTALEKARRAGYLALGFAMLGLGVAGVFLPVMPTTVFVILAAFCFGRSSPRLETWLLQHPRFGPPLQAWREEGAIPTRAKVLAVAGMALGFGLFLVSARPGYGAMFAVAAFMLAGAAYVLSRPRPRRRLGPPES
ncbi:YbaN family protein [Aquibium microcysteis]|uniref:YbaN family protein n=1 Tax=Aquibium microcysteis TaxID=675281 RepID=UPI001EF37983|nr:YbaN family protein [Aquibium microcysteis]